MDIRDIDSGSYRIRKISLVLALAIFFFVIIIMGITFDSVLVKGSVNSSTVTKVKIDNTAPDLNSVIITPSIVDLLPGVETIVNCTGFYYDYDGWDDLNNSNATLYHIGESSHDSIDDNNNHYTNSSCDCFYGGTGRNGTCVCSFKVWYYATNGTWVCNMSISDSQFFDVKNVTGTISTVIGVGVPEEIDYGNLSVTEKSEVIEANISNWGNVPINVSIRAWGGTEGYSSSNNDTALVCDVGNISHSYQRYSANISATFENMFNTSNTSTLLPDFSLPVRTNDTHYGNDTNATYWQLELPSGLGGFCNGTVEFNGIPASI